MNNSRSAHDDVPAARGGRHTGGDALRRARLPVFTVQRLGVVMAPEPGNPLEVEGVLNPAGATGTDGHYYLFPRLVAAGNYSRIGLARVRRDGADRPIGVERLDVVLEPQMPYELLRPGVGGCEDPCITYLPCANVYVMAYTALGPRGPHVALASSRDLRTWRRHGLVDFAPERGTDFNLYTNKDALLLPEPVVSPGGPRALALLHRPSYERWLGCDGAGCVPAPPPAGIADDRPSIWISYCALGELDWLGGAGPPRFAHHHLRTQSVTPCPLTSAPSAVPLYDAAPAPRPWRQSTSSGYDRSATTVQMGREGRKSAGECTWHFRQTGRGADRTRLPQPGPARPARRITHESTVLHECARGCEARHAPVGRTQRRVRAAPGPRGRG
jgi:hypothetical protein